jgi:hypothetical protein
VRAVKVSLEEAVKILQLPMVAISPRQKRATFLPEDIRGGIKCAFEGAIPNQGYRIGAIQAISMRGEIGLFDYESHTIIGVGELRYILHSVDANDKNRPPIWHKVGEHVVPTSACTWFFTQLKRVKIVTKLVSPNLTQLRIKTEPFVWTMPRPSSDEWKDLLADDPESRVETGASAGELEPEKETVQQ